MLVEEFRELRVYRNGYEAAMLIFAWSKKWPRDERTSLFDQIRRSSRSVCTNIAEAWGKRRYVSHFVSKLSDADTEAQETRSWLDFALGCEYINRDEFSRLEKDYRVIGRPGQDDGRS
jgi:four helix bundle protein